MRFWIISLVVIVIDQIIKWYIPRFGTFYVINPGAAFSFGSQWPWFEWVIWGAFIAFISLFIKEGLRGNINKKFPYFLILSGSVSNLIDRLFFRGVIDYIKIWRFPILNLADIAITLGIILFTFSIIKSLLSKFYFKQALKTK